MRNWWFRTGVRQKIHENQMGGRWWSVLEEPPWIRNGYKDYGQVQRDYAWNMNENDCTIEAWSTCHLTALIDIHIIQLFLDRRYRLWAAHHHKWTAKHPATLVVAQAIHRRITVAPYLMTPSKIPALNGTPSPMSCTTMSPSTSRSHATSTREGNANQRWPRKQITRPVNHTWGYPSNTTGQQSTMYCVDSNTVRLFLDQSSSRPRFDCHTDHSFANVHADPDMTAVRQLSTAQPRAATARRWNVWMSLARKLDGLNPCKKGGELLASGNLQSR